MRRLHLTSTLVGILLPPLLVAGAPTAVAAPDDEPAPASPTDSVEDPAADIGTWSVSPAGPDTWTLSWAAPRRLPVTTDRPEIVAAEELDGLAAGTPLGVPTVAPDGRTVEVTVTSTTEPAPELLDVVLSGEVLDEDTAPEPAPGPTPRWEEPGQELLPVDPGRRGALPITSSDYELPGLRVPGMRADVEMVGHVVEPAPEAADPSHPLVLFLHGRHSYCYNPETGRMGWRWPCAGAQVPIPSHLGYDYVQRLLASQGYVTVSVAANGINAQDGASPDGGAAARSRLVQAHLDRWVRWAARSRHQVDLDQVVLVGHSRGGEGVSRASLEIPLSAPYTVVGQVLIGPTNFGRQTTPYVPTVTVLPSCDGDVIDLQGQSYTDLARGLATGDTAMKSSVMSVGANHNFFNTEWTPGLAAAPAWDDWGGRRGICGKGAETRLSAAEQRRVGKAYVAGAVHLFADGDQDYRPMFDGSAVRVGSTGDAVVLSHMLGGDRTLRVPGAGVSLTRPVGSDTLLCRGTTPWGRTRKPLCGRYAQAPESTPHWHTAGSLIPTHQAFQMSWQSAGGEGGLELADPLDLSGSDWLDLRTVVDPKVGDITVRVRLTDGGGSSVAVDPVGGGALPAMPTGDEWPVGKYWAQTLRVRTADVTGIDVSDVERVELVGTSDRGRLWVLDLAAAARTLPTVPAQRVPIVDLGRVRVDEGGNGTHLARVPFTVTGEVTRPAELWVYGFDGVFDGGEAPAPVRTEVTLPVGSGGDGTIGWEYPGDTVDSYPKVVHELFGHAIRDVMMRDNQGRVVVMDDDPSPTVGFEAVRSRATEGGRAEFRATLSAPVGYEMAVGLYAVRGDRSATPLRAHDVGRRWLERWTSWKPGTDPALHRLEVNHWGWFRPGETTKTFRIPLREDGRVEPRESLTVRASAEGGWRSPPTTVVVRANP